jgi:hypothetical protein
VFIIFFSTNNVNFSSHRYRTQPDPDPTGSRSGSVTLVEACVFSFKSSRFADSGTGWRFCHFRLWVEILISESRRQCIEGWNPIKAKFWLKSFKVIYRLLIGNSHIASSRTPGTARNLSRFVYANSPVDSVVKTGVARTPPAGAGCILYKR